VDDLAQARLCLRIVGLIVDVIGGRHGGAYSQSDRRVRSTSMAWFS
jgi:hypothetical protein